MATLGQKITQINIFVLVRELLAVIFPNNCAACERPMAYGESVICTQCLNSLPYTDYHLYPENPVEKLFWGKTPLRAATSLFYFNKGNHVQRLMHELKYRKDEEVGLVMGRMLGVVLQNNQRFGSIDRVVPVPLHPKKLRLRGYNQSELIARGIAEEIGAILDSTTLVRTVNTTTQTRKSRFDRYKNVQQVFGLKDYRPSKPEHILLVDDVVTTGATLSSCAEAYKQVDNTEVSLCVAACAE